MGAETSIAYNCLDRHLEAGHGDRVAFYWEGNDLNEQSVTTYKQLQEQVKSAFPHCHRCNASKMHGPMQVAPVGGISVADEL